MRERRIHCVALAECELLPRAIVIGPAILIGLQRNVMARPEDRRIDMDNNLRAWFEYDERRLEAEP